MNNHTPMAGELWRDLRRNPSALTATVVFVVFVLMATMASIIAPFDPYNPLQIDISDSELPPAWEEDGDSRFVWGTDHLGRDLFSAILYGLRTSIIIGVFAVLLQAFLGISIGLIAGYTGGRVDAILMRIADIQLSFSSFMVAIIALAVFQALFGAEKYEDLALLMLILVIGISEWPQYARTVRAVVLAEKQKEYIAASRVLGYPPLRIILRHLLPNTLTPVMVISAVQTANAIISEASLSFLGLGMPVTKPSLGSLIHIGFEYIFSGVWWITLFPSVALIMLIMSINVLGDFLRDFLNPYNTPSTQ